MVGIVSAPFVYFLGHLFAGQARQHSTEKAPRTKLRQQNTCYRVGSIFWWIITPPLPASQIVWAGHFCHEAKCVNGPLHFSLIRYPCDD